MRPFYFIGIGGTAMGSVAVALKELGHDVTGSDSGVYPPMCDFLLTSGIPYFSEFNPHNLRTFQGATIVVGNAISRGNPELEEALNQRLPLVSLPEIVHQILIRRHYSIVVSGTHGKTTTTSLLSWMLESTGLKPGFLLGGIHANFHCGCRPANTSDGQDHGYFVVEGDEYDSAFFDKRSKFLHYRPNLAIINNIEFDHADIFPDLDAICLSFSRMIQLIPRNGLLLVGTQSPEALELSKKSHAKVETFGLEAEADWQVVDLETSEQGVDFTVVHHRNELGRLRSPLFGEHNCRNTLACIAAAYFVGVPFSAFQNALSGFHAPKRRLEIIFNQNKITLMDDFAHHPTAIAETLKAARQMYPNRRIIACFEPRSNTSTRSIFQADFTQAFQLADIVVFGPVNRPERYSESEHLNTELILNELKKQGKTGFVTTLPTPPDYVQKIVAYISYELCENDLILIMSNGSFGGLLAEMKKVLEDRYSC